MINKTQKGQGAVWVILIIAVIALIALWISKNPSLPTSKPVSENTDAIVSPSATVTNTPSKSLQEIEQSLKELNTDSQEIDKSLNDTQLDITQ